MTDHADLSRRLALAIGWPESSIIAVGRFTYIRVELGEKWRAFDYRDEQIIWRVAERYNAFPVKTSETQWLAGCRTTGPRATGVYMHAPTAAEAVARAVVGARG